MYMFLAGINKNLDEVRGRILGKRPLPSLREVFSDVRRGEKQRKAMMGEGNQLDPEASDLAARNNQSTQPGGQNRSQKRRGDKVWCDHCHKPRHKRDKCWELHGKPPKWKPKSFGQPNRDSRAFRACTEEKSTLGGTSETPLFSKEQLEQLYKLLQCTQLSNNVSTSC